MIMKDKLELVTIITLSYKKYDYIMEAIDSVLKQDYPNIQYIISDDGADNCPREKIESYVKNNSTDNIKDFSLLTRESNVGTVKNLNQAISRAEGEYIIVLSADDVFYSVDVVTRIVNDFYRLQCNVLGTLRLRCDKDLQPICYMPAKYYQRRIKTWDTARKQYEAFVSGRHFEMASGSVLSYKKSYLERHMFDESYFLWEDGPFIERYLREGNFLHLDYSFTAIYYREGGISTSGGLNPLMQKDMSLYIKRVYKNSKGLVGILSYKLIESRLGKSECDSNICGRIRRNVKYFYLVPLKVYDFVERKFVCGIERMFIKIRR